MSSGGLTCRTVPCPQVSLDLLASLHARWTALLGRLDGEQWQRPYVHPVDGPRTVEGLVQLYVWHGRHHTAQIQQLRARMSW